jgi:predicted negative regulator of RcsB-dependent stress response
MDYSEDEQVEKLKAWWKSYGNALIAGVALGLAILFGGRYWQHYQAEKAAEASALFDELVYSINEKKNNNVSVLGSRIIKDYARTPYAGLAALILARENYDRHDKEKAKKQLAWAIDNARENGVRQVARLRLARIQLADDNIVGAEQLLKVEPIPGFELDFYELKGDVLKKKGDKAGARTAYGKAIAHAGSAGKYINKLQMKIDDLG